MQTDAGAVDGLAPLNEQEREVVAKIKTTLDGLDPEAASRVVQNVADIPPALLEMFQENPALKDIYFDPKLTPHQRKLKMLPFLGKLHRDQDAARKNIKRLNAELEHKEGLLKATEESEAWLKTSPVLEKNDCTRLHHLGQAFKTDSVVVHDGKPLSDKLGDGQHWKPEALKRFQPFIVQHDWSKAFEGATDYAEGEIKLPYNECIFEFRISGKTVIIFAAQDSVEVIRLLPFIQFGDFWIIAAEMVTVADATNKNDFFGLAAKEIRAISIALDAEVATHKVMRAPHALNVKREREGKLPIYDYHVVQLAGKHKIANALRNPGDGTKKRLHFRRGHWRHFAAFKTWVRWTLVGDPALGFVDKEYRL